MMEKKIDKIFRTMKTSIKMDEKPHRHVQKIIQQQQKTKI